MISDHRNRNARSLGFDAHPGDAVVRLIESDRLRPEQLQP